MNCGGCGAKDVGKWRLRSGVESCDYCDRIAMGKRSKLTPMMKKYVKSRYIGPDGHVKCDKRYKPAEHYLGS